MLSKLIVNVHTALMSEIPLDHDPVCYTNSEVALHWIRGNDCEWKQFVENRVISVRSLVPSEHWRHCLGISNPADIPSRGMLPSELSECQLWLNGPDWLYTPTYLTNSNSEEIIPEECQQELKRSTTLLTSDEAASPRLDHIIKCAEFTSHPSDIICTEVCIPTHASNRKD